jgi:predicted O-methyltransferase YrrM
MSVLGNIIYLRRRHAPFGVIAQYLATSLARRRLRDKHAAVSDDLRKFAKDNGFQRDWFTSNVPFWMEIFDRCGLRDRPTNVMEIGSFEGLSACFLLRQLPEARLTCVDTWQGSDEHAGMELIASTEAAFDRHVAPWRERVTKRKGYSLPYLASLRPEDKFDLIYVDGSHHADDVLVDAIRGFEQLKVGGVMILDDYLWRYYSRSSENPATAINAFLRVVEGRYRLVLAYYQLAIEKTAERST